MDHQQCGQKTKKQNLRWNNNLGEPRYSGSQESQTNSDNLNLLKTRLPSMTDRYQSHHTETKLHSIATSFTLVNATFLESEENMRRIDKKKAIMKQTSSVVKLKLFSDGQPVARIQWWTAFRPTESLIKVYLSICLLWWTGFSQIMWIPVLPNCFFYKTRQLQESYNVFALRELHSYTAELSSPIFQSRLDIIVTWLDLHQVSTTAVLYWPST